MFQPQQEVSHCIHLTTGSGRAAPTYVVPLTHGLWWRTENEPCHLTASTKVLSVSEPSGPFQLIGMRLHVKAAVIQATDIRTAYSLMARELFYAGQSPTS